MSVQQENGLAEFFVDGVEPADVPQFFPLFEARPLIGAMIALFRGGDDEVMVRLMVLREIGLRAEAPEWSPRELQSHFAFINQSKLNTVLGRLREHELLLWDNERHVYQLSSAGRMVLSAISSLLSFSTEQDGELGFLAAQIAAGSAVGKLSPEALAHLLARLAELEEEFSQAVTSGSEFRLRAAQSKLASVWQWMEKANEVLRDLSAEGFADDASWRLAQEIGNRQSRIMRMSSVFQRELAEISRQQVHLSHGGLSSSELAAWLKQRSVDELVELAAGQLNLTPECTFILPDVMVDNTEEFVAREQPNRRVSAMPAPPKSNTLTTSRTNRRRSWPRWCVCCPRWKRRSPFPTASSAAASAMPRIACRCCPSSVNRTSTPNSLPSPDCRCACAGTRASNCRP